MVYYKIKGGDFKTVYLSLVCENRNTNNLIHTKRCRLTQLAEFLGAKEVKLLDETVIMRDGMVILDYYDSLKDNSFKEIWY